LEIAMTSERLLRSRRATDRSMKHELRFLIVAQHHQMHVAGYVDERDARSRSSSARFLYGALPVAGEVHVSRRRLGIRLGRWRVGWGRWRFRLRWRFLRWRFLRWRRFTYRRAFAHAPAAI